MNVTFSHYKGEVKTYRITRLTFYTTW